MLTNRRIAGALLNAQLILVTGCAVNDLEDGTDAEIETTLARRPKPRSCGFGDLAVSPDPIPADSSFHIDGCGYTPSAGFQINLYQPNGVSVQGAITDASGCLYNAVGYATAAGTVKVDLLEGSVTRVACRTFTIL